MIITGERLLELLPAIYRLRDGEIAAAMPPNSNGTPPVGPLQALLTLVAEQLSILSADLDQLYEDQFIETCAPWVIPYIGDLIGYQPVNGIAPLVASPRAEVAHTISFRRRKGTILVLEQIAGDVTGWGAHAVEFFRLLTGTQYMNHLRLSSGGTPDLRQWQVAEYMGGAFDTTPHNIDVRSISSGAPRHNIQSIGIFLWSINAYPQPLSPATPVPAAPQCFRFSALGADMPLFTRPKAQPSTITAGALPVNVPGRLHRRVLCQDLQSGVASAYYGAGSSLLLTINGGTINSSQIAVCDLSGLDGHWKNLPATGSPYVAAIDPELGRIALPPLAAGAAAPNVQVSFCYGFSADMAGGEYPRSSSFPAALTSTPVHVPNDHPTLHEAIAALNGAGVIEVDSGTYFEPAGLTVNVNANATIELRAADGAHPTLVLGQTISVTGGTLSSFYLNGFLVTCPPPAAGTTAPVALLHVPAASNQLANLNLAHCTLVPGWSLSANGSPVSPSAPALVAELPGLALSLSRTITGSLRVHPEAATTLSDSIVDALGPAAAAYSGLDAISAGGALTCTGCTLVGKVHTTVLSLLSNTIVLASLAAADTWSAALWADRRQQGCVRFSYLPASTVVPQPYRCVTQAFGSPDPRFTTLRYGQPEYAKLLASTDDAIRRGADDGSEMGAFHFVLAPLREADLRVRLAEYLAVGMECGLIYAT